MSSTTQGGDKPPPLLWDDPGEPLRGLVGATLQPAFSWGLWAGTSHRPYYGTTEARAPPVWGHAATRLQLGPMGDPLRSPCWLATTWRTPLFCWDIDMLY